MTEQVGRGGRPVSDVANDLGCDWHTANEAVRELDSFVDFELARTWIDDLLRDVTNSTWPVETLTRAHAQELAP